MVLKSDFISKTGPPYGNVWILLCILYFKFQHYTNEGYFQMHYISFIQSEK